MHKGAAVLLLFATFVALCASQASVDRSALLALYNSAGGTGWTTKWNTANPSLCTGNGATVTCWDDGKVRKIDLKVNKLSGSLPTQIGLLTKMQNLILTTNALTGPIPTEICLLTDLSTLALNFNSFTGSIPTCLGNLVRLTAIILEGNKLTGSIPTQISNHPKAGEIRLSNNQLSGTLPTLWRQGVGSILLESNSLTGSIPSEIIASGVKRLRLANNKLSGSLPEVSSDSLTEYYIFSNQITGSIPTHLGANSQLQRFWAYSNKLSGSLPSQIGTAKTLFDLRVMGNSLTGTIPTTFENSKLRFIWLSQNSISGQIPSQLGNLSQLTSLRLDENMITGYIPGPVLRNPSLNDLTLSKNCLAPVGIYSGFSSNDFDSFVPNSACTPSGPFEEAASDFPLFASYRFSSDAPLADTSGNGVDLILYDPALFDETHLFGQALNPYNTALFARSFSSFGLRSRARFSLFGDFTVELLVSSTLGSNNYLFAFSSGSIETGQLLSLMLGVDGTLSLLDDDLTPLIQVAGQFSPNRVHHLAVTWNVFGQELKLYVDGTLHGQTVVSPTVPVNGFHYLYLAGSQTAIFDEANLYSAELSQADIQSKISALDWCPLLSCLGTCTPTTNGALCS